MLEREVVTQDSVVSFYFDPICPWTWITSRWLLDVARQRDLTITWRTFSLVMLNGGVENMPERFQEGGRFSMRALRVMEALRQAGENERIGELFTALGNRLHVDREPPTRELLATVMRDCGIERYLTAADDVSWDAAIQESTDEAMALAGPDVGSPVLRLAGSDHGIHGPIVSPAPFGQDALRVWDAMVTLLAVPGFYELKHERSGAPAIAETAAREPATSNV